MLLSYPDPNRLTGIWSYGPEDREDSDSDLTPVCAGCDGPVDGAGYCRDCQEYGA